MEKRFCLFMAAICFAVLLSTYSQAKEKTTVVLPKPGSEQAKSLMKSEVVTDENGKILKIIHYPTEEAAKKRGVIKQIDEYNGSNNPLRFIMMFTEENKNATGFSKRIDYVDENDKLIKVDMFFNDIYIFSIDEDDEKAFPKYPLHRMWHYYEKYHSDRITENEFANETPMFGGTTYVRYLNKISDTSEDISEKEKRLILNWAKMRKATGFEALYNKKVYVRERGIEFWVCFQDSLLQYLKKDLDMILRYYYIGEIKEGPVYLVTYMKELGEITNINR